MCEAFKIVKLSFNSIYAPMFMHAMYASSKRNKNNYLKSFLSYLLFAGNFIIPPVQTLRDTESSVTFYKLWYMALVFLTLEHK